MAIQFQKATKKRSKLRLAFDGPAGSGKTMSALLVAKGLARGGKIAVIDTERGSASLYSDEVQFDVVELDTFSPDAYVEAIKTAEDLGYAVIIIDSLSHAWEGKDGALDKKEREARRPGVNDWTAWRMITPMHNRLVDAMLQSKAHVIATMRTKMEYVQEKDEKGKVVIRKVGMEYEFSVVGDLDYNHVLTISKTRCKALDGAQIPMPGERLAKTLLDWLEQGEDSSPAPAASAPTPPPAGSASGETKNGAASPRAEEAIKDAVAQETAVSPVVVTAGNPASPDYAKKISDATNEKELQAVALEIKKTKPPIAGPEREKLLALYDNRLAALRTVAPERAA
jgi:nucleoside-triphosphatase THEP1